MKVEASWKECVEKNSSISVTSNIEKAKSLIDNAEGRNEFLDNSLVSEKSANYIFEGYYSSVLELLHAIVIIDGYKVKNHICLGFYLRDVLEEDVMFRKFDNCRFKRNSLIYYGRKMEFEVAEQAIKNCKELILEFTILLENKM